MGKEWLVPTGFSLAVHVVLVGLLAVSLALPSKPAPTPNATVQPIEAVAVDPQRVEQELKRLRDEESQRAELAKKLEQQRKSEQQRLAELKRQSEQEQKRRQEQEKADQARLAKLKAEQEALKKQQAQKQKELAELEQARKIEAKKRAEEEAKRQQAAAERERIEAERQRQEAERKRIEAERQRQAEERKQREAAEAAIKQRIAAEQRRIEQEEAAARARMLDTAKVEYVGLIAAKVTRNWLRPAGSPAEFSCKVLVRQIPGGDVVGVQILESSGFPAIDRSVEAAVRKASPLPRPSEPELFEREIVFYFEP